jgi:hypothetical protein
MLSLIDQLSKLKKIPTDGIASRVLEVTPSVGTFLASLSQRCFLRGQVFINAMDGQLMMESSTNRIAAIFSGAGTEIDARIQCDNGFQFEFFCQIATTDILLKLDDYYALLQREWRWRGGPHGPTHLCEILLR